MLPLRGVAAVLVVAGVLSAACGSSTPTGPAPIAAVPVVPPAPAVRLSLSGTWVGFMRIQTCDTSNGCAGYANRIDDFSLTLTETGSSVTGHFQHGNNRDFSADVAGTLNADGSVVLTGKTPPPTFSLGFSAVITNLTITRDAARGVYATSFTYVSTSAGRTNTFQAAIESTSLGAVVVPPAAGAPLDGNWTGTIRTDVCSGNLCGKLPRSDSFQLTVITGGGLRALLTIVSASHFNVVMTGTTQPDGSVVFSGSTPAGGPLVSAGPFEMPLLQLRVDAAGNMTGEFSKRATYDGRSPQISSGVIVSGSRVQSAFSAGPFQGAWDGSAVIRSCTGECDLVTVGKEIYLGLELSDSGGPITGAITVLSGSAKLFATGFSNSTTATLTGSQSASYCGPDDTTVVCAQTLHPFAVTLDEFRQMKGTMELYVDVWMGYGPHRRYTITAELLSVVRAF